jgi:hypothetical protein
MQTGKMPPIMRFFMGAKRTESSNRDASFQQNFQDSPQKEPSEEEIFRAAEILNESEDFKKNSLKCEVVREGDFLVISVKNASGIQIRSIKSSEIFRTIATLYATERNRHGRILDRRI